VPAIGNLYGRRRALPSAFGVRSGTIAGDYLNAWMLIQPVSDNLRAALGMYVNDTSTLQVADDRPVASPAPPRPVVAL